MPRVEFESDEQREKLQEWLSTKEDIGEAVFISNAYEMDKDNTYYTLYFCNEEPLITKTTGLTYPKIVEIGFSDAREEELRIAGVIFERGKSPHSVMRSGSLESQSTRVYNAGDQI